VRKAKTKKAQKIDKSGNNVGTGGKESGRDLCRFFGELFNVSTAKKDMKATLK
jgi:hypothetical protein